MAEDRLMVWKNLTITAQHMNLLEIIIVVYKLCNMMVITLYIEYWKSNLDRSLLQEII